MRHALHHLSRFRTMTEKTKVKPRYKLVARAIFFFVIWDSNPATWICFFTMVEVLNSSIVHHNRVLSACLNARLRVNPTQRTAPVRQRHHTHHLPDPPPPHPCAHRRNPGGASTSPVSLRRRSPLPRGCPSLMAASHGCIASGARSPLVPASPLPRACLPPPSWLPLQWRLLCYRACLPRLPSFFPPLCSFATSQAVRALPSCLPPPLPRGCLSSGGCCATLPSFLPCVRLRHRKRCAPSPLPRGCTVAAVLVLPFLPQPLPCECANPCPV